MLTRRPRPLAEPHIMDAPLTLHLEAVATQLGTRKRSKGASPPPPLSLCLLFIIVDHRRWTPPSFTLLIPRRNRRLINDREMLKVIFRPEVVDRRRRRPPPSPPHPLRSQLYPAFLRTSFPPLRPPPVPGRLDFGMPTLCVIGPRRLLLRLSLRLLLLLWWRRRLRRQLCMERR